MEPLGHLVDDGPERLGRLLALTAKAVREQFDQDLAAIGSSLNTYIILRTAAHGGLSQRQLAAALCIEGPTMTHHLDRLAADGLIARVRDEVDRRISRVHLTPEGAAHLARVESHAAQLDAELRSTFTPSEVEILTGLLTRLRSRYGKEADVHASR